METKAREGLEYIQFFNSDREIVRVESLRGVFPEKDVVTQVVLLQEFERLEAENKKLREAILKAQAYLEMHYSNRKPSNVAWADIILNEALGEVGDELQASKESP